MQRLLTLALLYASTSYADPGHTVTLEVNGIASTEGQLMVVLFDQAQGFPNKPDLAFRKALAAPETPTTRVSFADVPAGTYAAMVVHDENGNGEVDTRWPIPIPKEPMGASRDAKFAMGPPKFNAAAFEVSGDTTQSFSIRRF
jgi:uncharacterized protein (DUF2141 family)